MELRQLLYFVTVADELNFRRAAQRLNIVQPAVSQQIRRLERELDVPLFERTSRSVSLTAAGARLLIEARSVLAAVEHTREVAADLAGGGVVRLGTSQGLGERLALLLDELARRAPDLRVELVSVPSARRLALVRSGRLDAAVLRARPAVRDLELLELWREPLVAALPAGHPLAASPGLTLEQLRDLPLRLAARDDNPDFHDFLLAACAEAGFEPLLGPPFTTLQDTLADLAAGPPSWTALYAATADQLAVGRVVFRRLAGAAVPTLLAVPPSPPTPKLRALIDAFAAVDAA